MPVASEACTQDHGRTTERNAAGHPPIVSAQIEPCRRLRLSGGYPFEQPPMPHEQTKEGSHDRVGHQPRLMREECDQQSPPATARATKSVPTARQCLRCESPNLRGTIPVMKPATAGESRRSRRRTRSIPRRRTKAASIPPATRGMRPAPTASAAGCRSSSSGRSAESPSADRRVHAAGIPPVRAPKIHGNSCQSPRAHRCWRAAATS